MEIWLIDDDDIYRMLAGKILSTNTKEEYQLVEFENARQPLNELGERLDFEKPMPNIILLDINMPAYDGWQFLEDYQLLMKRYKGPIPELFMVSSSVNFADIKRAKSNELVRDYVTKPFSEDFVKQLWA
jgi:CheY-like chemotaxis protein